MLKYKGIFNSNEQLPVAELPANANQYKEPETLSEMNTSTILYAMPIIVIAFIMTIFTENWFSLWGFPLFLASMVVHEFIHYLAYSRKAEVELFFAPKQLSLFVTSTHPMHYVDFIWQCLVPNIVLGVFPLIVCCFIPNNVLFTFGILSLMGGISDYGNIIRTIKQVPYGATIQNSGIHSYWYN